MAAAKVEVSDRARAIIEGLLRTGRGSGPHVAGAHIRLCSKIDGFYWVRLDGSRLLRGHNLQGAARLQKSFTETMVRAGEPPPKGKR
jgi:hypothetical protein